MFQIASLVYKQRCRNWNGNAIGLRFRNGIVACDAFLMSRPGNENGPLRMIFQTRYFSVWTFGRRIKWQAIYHTAGQLSDAPITELMAKILAMDNALALGVLDRKMQFECAAPSSVSQVLSQVPLTRNNPPFSAPNNRQNRRQIFVRTSLKASRKWYHILKYLSNHSLFFAKRLWNASTKYIKFMTKFF